MEFVQNLENLLLAHMSKLAENLPEETIRLLGRLQARLDRQGLLEIGNAHVASLKRDLSK